MIPLKYKSEVKPWVAGSTLEFQTSSLPKHGPKGGRLVIDAIIAHAQLQIDVTVADLQGEDVYRAFKSLTVKQRDGVLRYNEVPGDALRVFLYQEIGGDRTKEHPDVAVANNVIVTATAYMPLAKRNVQRDEDYSLAADLLHYVKIGCATTSDLSEGATTVAIDSGNYWLIFECHEELDIVYHAVDEVKVQDFESTTQEEARLQVNGRLQSLALYVRGENGGASLANLTSAWIHLPQNMAPELLLDPDLKEFYARTRNEATGSSATTGNPLRSNPFTASTIRACSVLMTTSTSCYEQPETDTVVVKTDHTLGATITMVARVAKPRNLATQKAIAKRFKLKGNFRMKTKSKSKWNPSEWREEDRAYMPIKFTS